MSEFEPFPRPEQVSSAHKAVFDLNQSLIENAVTAENRQIESGGPPEELQSLAAVYTPKEYLQYRRKEIFTKLPARHIRALGGIGIVLDLVLAPGYTTVTEVKDVERAVPELIDPHCFAAYLEDVTSDRPLRSPNHIKLVGDVVEHIYYKLSKNELEIAEALTAKPRNEKEIWDLFIQRYPSITQFMAIQPIYKKAKLEKYSPYYGQVKNWVKPYSKGPV